MVDLTPIPAAVLVVALGGTILPACSPGRTLRGAPEHPDGSILRFDAAMLLAPDAGRAGDGGPLPRDAGRVVRDTCTTDADCDDGVACTIDACVADGTCSRTRSDVACVVGEACLLDVPGSGCVSGARCTSSACDPLAGCGCAAGQACVYGDDGLAACRLAGSSVEGSPCDPDGRCAPGLACLAAGPGAPSTCSRYCDTDADCPTDRPGSLCEMDTPLHEDDPTFPVRICSRGCNPVTADGCATGTSCQIFGVRGFFGRFFTDCRPDGTGEQFDRCVVTEDCARGYACVDGGDGLGHLCRHLCRWEVLRADCPTGLACVFAFTPAAVVDGEEYGTCDYL